VKDVPVFIGRIDNDTDFLVAIDGTTYSVRLPAVQTEANRNILELVTDINNALSKPGVRMTPTGPSLASPASFTVVIDGGGAVPVSVAADGTAVLEFDSVVDVDPTANTITIAGHGLKTGQELTYSAGVGTVVDGLTEGSVYAIVVDANTIRLADSNANATAGSAIDLLADGTGVHSLTETGANNATLADQAADINRALNQAGVADQLRAKVEGTRILLELRGGASQLTLTAAGAAVTDLGLPSSQTVKNLSGILRAESQDTRLVLTRIDGGSTHFTLSTAPSDPGGLAELGFSNGQASNNDDLRITLSDGSVHFVNLDGATTLGAVRTEIVNQVGASNIAVTYSVDDPATPADEADKSLVLEDKTFPGGSLFKVEATNASEAGVRLGIVASDKKSPSDSPDGFIEGGVLAGASLFDRLFIENAVIGADFFVETESGFNALAKFGFVGVTLTGDGTVGPDNRILEGRVEAGLKTPGAGSPGGRVTLTQLIDNLDDIGEIVALPTFSGSGGLTVTLGLDAAGLDIGNLLGVTPTFTITIADLGNPLAETSFSGVDAPEIVSGNVFKLAGDLTAQIPLGGNVTIDVGGTPVLLPVTAIEFLSGENKTRITVALDALATIGQAGQDLQSLLVSALTIDTPTLPNIQLPTAAELEALLGDIGQFGDIGFDEILAGLLALSDFLGQFEAFDFLDERRQAARGVGPADRPRVRRPRLQLAAFPRRDAVRRRCGADRW
jgi:hypothetical protein